MEPRGRQTGLSPPVSRAGMPLTPLDQHLFVDPPDAATRLWAIDLALRCPAVAVTVADGSRLDMAATRRLQLAAHAGGGLGLLARPPWEISELSAAATRWSIRVCPSRTGRPNWKIRLLRCKGMRPDTDPALKHTAVVVEWSREKSLICIPAELVGRSGAAAAATVPEQLHLRIA